MKNLFYSQKENLLFFITGYLNEENVSAFIQTLTKNAVNLANLAGKNISDINTYPINNSKRYKGMRVFYVKTKIIPKNAFEISSENNWTMQKWISD